MKTLTDILSLKSQVKINLPERADRKLILEALVPKHALETVDMLEVAKYLQGKTFKEIR